MDEDNKYCHYTFHDYYEDIENDNHNCLNYYTCGDCPYYYEDKNN